MTTGLTALILDFGGVLTTDLWASVRACAVREGLPQNALLDLLRNDPTIHPQFVALERGEVGQLEFERELASAAGISPEGLLGRMCADLRPDLAMLEVTAAIRRAGVRVGVLSNTWGSGYFNPYAGYDLDERTDAVVLSDLVNLRKPEPAIFDLMVERLGVAAGSCLFVDDVATNLPPARAIGMTVVHHVDSPATVARLKEAFADYLTASSSVDRAE